MDQARRRQLKLFEARRLEMCKELEQFDKGTEVLISRGEISQNRYDERKSIYREAFDLHCNERRAAGDPPTGLIDLYHFISREISELERESEELLAACYKSGSCYADSC